MKVIVSPYPPGSVLKKALSAPPATPVALYSDTGGKAAFTQLHLIGSAVHPPSFVDQLTKANHENESLLQALPCNPMNFLINAVEHLNPVAGALLEFAYVVSSGGLEIHEALAAGHDPRIPEAKLGINVSATALEHLPGLAGEYISIGAMGADFLLTAIGHYLEDIAPPQDTSS